MTREIKYRAWDLVSSTMRHVSVIEFDAAGEICNIALAAPGLDTKHGYHARFEERENGDDLILMQYTGLHDKNGVEIFEGDVLKCKNSSQGVLIWNTKRAGYLLDTTQTKDGWTHPIDGFDIGTAEVTGNIYENPELLK